jgi:hypothetical protein
VALALDESRLQVLTDHHHAAMITLCADTLCADGTPHVAQVGIGLVDGPDGTRRLWASGAQRGPC